MSQLQSEFTYELLSKPGKFQVMTGLFDDDQGSNPVRRFTVQDPAHSGGMLLVDIEIWQVTRHLGSATKAYRVVGNVREERAVGQQSRTAVIELSMTNNKGTVLITEQPVS